MSEERREFVFEVVNDIIDLALELCKSIKSLKTKNKKQNILLSSILHLLRKIIKYGLVKTN